MNEKRETEFALIFGQMLGFLAADDIRKYLKDMGLTDLDLMELDVVRDILKKVAKKAFYNHE